jgi:SAM-dependent methyltransferase
MTPRRGSYGIDAPGVVGGFAAATIGIAVVAIAIGMWTWLITAAVLAVIAGVAYHTTRRGKFRVWAERLDALGLRGDERVLDVGCGRGAVLMLAAERVPRGKAVGIDLWRTRDQSGNDPEVTRRNAEAEGVADRVEIVTGDMTQLPFEDASFDLVVSSLAIHNVHARGGREKALGEAGRVLRPGGRLLIADLPAARRYPARLTELGMADVASRNAGWRMWWGGPWVPTIFVGATKPVSS